MITTTNQQIALGALRCCRSRLLEIRRDALTAATALSASAPTVHMNLLTSWRTCWPTANAYPSSLKATFTVTRLGRSALP